MVSLPVQLSYGHVRGRVVSVVGIGNPPGAQGITGPVVFTPAPAYLTVVSDQTIVKLSPTTVTPDIDGNFGAYLIATDDVDTNPTGFTYRVDLSGALGFGVPGIDIAVPAGADLDLSGFIPVSASTGVLTARGPQGDPGSVQIAYDTDGVPYLL